MNDQDATYSEGLTLFTVEWARTPGSKVNNIFMATPCLVECVVSRQAEGNKCRNGSELAGGGACALVPRLQQNARPQVSAHVDP